MPLLVHASWLDDELSLHAPVTPAAVHAAAEGIDAGGLRYKFYSFRLAFFDSEAALRGGEDQAGLAAAVDSVCQF